MTDLLAAVRTPAPGDQVASLPGLTSVAGGAGNTVGGVLSTVANTPLVELTRIAPGLDARVFAKLEQFNPGGSIKDRSALSMVRGRVDSGELVPGRSVVVESSSGNLAVGMAQVCRYYGLRFVCVVDAKTNRQTLSILRAYGAEVDVVAEPDPRTGEFLPSRLARVRELVAAIPHAYWPNQYANPLNPKAHEQTMHEIANAMDGRVDYLFCSVGSFGTLRGCAQYVADHGLRTSIVGVDAVGSVIFDGQAPAPRHIPGHGASLRPPLYDAGAADHVVHVSDVECVAACRRLVATEAILAGGSSGATVSALEKFADRIPPGARCALIFPDTGDRYLDTIYCDSWVAERFGAVPATEVHPC
ncbi:2,3-diaminopropionate biosynthesis protein SbnA [Saccharothrix coeruleofusca]|uniref:N-(2-amino-2-carboxyethyl)-L-glutamate synthase n=1 Tax=Saccharothrix coeruleofusca TaxID=33919 RepID=A0A918ATJ5_9PSEU|nr:2,3-diaminopropionate biosynthesis protein SbnA [Saccharothrix coeruleofusca]GGP82514.1 2,3-diaminopropionate biosynthesis protein SbnA [Saccharothrix coeruleofusca]